MGIMRFCLLCHRISEQRNPGGSSFSAGSQKKIMDLNESEKSCWLALTNPATQINHCHSPVFQGSSRGRGHRTSKAACHPVGLLPLHRLTLTRQDSGCEGHCVHREAASLAYLQSSLHSQGLGFQNGFAHCIPDNLVVVPMHQIPIHLAWMIPLQLQEHRG